MARKPGAAGALLFVLCLLYLILYVDRVNISTAAGIFRDELKLSATDYGKLGHWLAPAVTGAAVDMLPIVKRQDRAAHDTFVARYGTFNQRVKRTCLRFGVGIENPESLPAGDVQQSLDPNIRSARVAEVLCGTTDPYSRGPPFECKALDVHQSF